VYVELVYRNILIAGEPGSGKSVALNNIVGHADRSPDVRLWLVHGKQVELGLWRDIADVFVGNHITDALTRLQERKEMGRRCDLLGRPPL
jgi:S-DNA-T family DNA segregation ATPase FtsK/SpoIIIE